MKGNLTWVPEVGLLEDAEDEVGLAAVVRLLC